MNERSEHERTQQALRDKIIGLGDRSLRKSYYPQLQERLEETEKSRNFLAEKSAALLNMLEDLEETKKGLTESQSQYRSLVENLSDAIFSLDMKGNVAYISPIIENLTGKPPEYYAGRRFAEIIAAEDMHLLIDCFKRALGGEETFLEFPLATDDGSRKHVRLSCRSRKENGRIVGLTGVLSDVTRSKEAEDSLLRTNRELRAISNCNQSLMRAQDERTLLQTICDIVCNEAGYASAWVGYVDGEKNESISTVVQAGQEYHGSSHNQLRLTNGENRSDPTVQAVRLGKAVCVQDMSLCSESASWVSEELERGYRSKIALPLKDELAATFGVLTIYSAEANAFAPPEIRLLEELSGDLAYGICAQRNRDEVKRAEQERQTHLWFLESMEAVNVAIQGASDLESMLNEVLEVALAIFRCHRASLGYPCSEGEETCRIAHERTHPEYPGALLKGECIRQTTRRTELQRRLLSSNRPVSIGPADVAGFDFEILPEMRTDYGIQSALMTAIYPKGDKPYQFGLHQCDSPRVWSDDEKALFEAIGQRLTDGLTSMLSFRNLQASEEKYRRIVDTASEGICEIDSQSTITFVNEKMAKMLGYEASEIIGSALTTLLFEGDADEHYRRMEARRRGLSDNYERRLRRKDGQAVWVLVSASPIFDQDGRVIGSFAMHTDITERKQAEDALRDSLLQLDAAQKTAKIGFWNLRLADKRIEWSSGLKAIFEIASDDPAPTLEEFLDYVHDEDKDFIANQILLHLASLDDSALSYRYRIVMKDGRTKYLEHFGRKKYDAQGVVVDIYGAVQDISERMQAEQALLEEQSLTNALIDGLPGIFYLYSYPELRLLRWNKNHETQLGYTHDDLVNRSVTDWHLNEAKAAVLAAAEIAMKTGQNQVETPLLAKDGSKVPFLLTGVKLETQGKQYLLGVGIDVTNQKRAETARNESEQRFQRLLECLPMPIACTNHEGKVTFWNDRFTKEFGYTGDDVSDISQWWTAAYPDERYRESVKRQWAEAIRIAEETGSDIPPDEYQITCKDGGVKDMIVSGIVINNDLLTTFVDVTERKRTEDALRHAGAELQKVNEQLRKASEVKDQFLAAMSHEIRTPMNAVIGMTGILLDTNLDSDQRDAAETIRTSGEVLLALINDILDFSKIEAGRMDLERQPFNLQQCVNEAFDLVLHQAQKKKLATSVEWDPHVPMHLVGDVTRLRQVLVNLLGNSIKFTEKGEVSLRVAAVQQENETYQLHFAVKDTGIGIQPDRSDRLFQAFSQMDASMNRRFGGSGLGLAISKRICEMMGGRIWAESTGVPGEGSVFHFTVLVRLADKEILAAEPSDDSRLTEKEISDRSAIQALRILLAEDNLVNQKVAQKLLEKIGCRADVVSNGKEAFDAYVNVGYDVILMDCQMPEMDGYDASRLIRRHERENSKKAVTIIAMTAHALQGDREKCLAAGMNDYLSKPVRQRELEHALAKGRSISDARGIEAPRDGSPEAGKADSASKNAEHMDDASLDRESLDLIAAGDVKGAREVIDMYLSQGRHILVDLRGASQKNDAAQVRQLAHKLAGSSAVCGLPIMVEPLRELEQKGADEKLEGTEELIERIERRLDLGEKLLTQYLRDLEGRS